MQGLLSVKILVKGAVVLVQPVIPLLLCQISEFTSRLVERAICGRVLLIEAAVLIVGDLELLPDAWFAIPSKEPNR